MMCDYIGRTKRTLVVLLATSLLVELGLASSSFKVNDFKAKVLEFDGITTKSMTMVYPEKSSEVIELDHTQKLKITFRAEKEGEDFVPDQAFIRLHFFDKMASPEGIISPHTEAYFAATRSKSSTALDATITAKGIEAQIGPLSGRFAVSLVLGSSSPAIAETWYFGEMVVSHKPLPDGSQPPVPKTALEAAAEMKKEIEHMHRQPEKRAPWIVSIAFSIVAVVPVLGFVAFVIKSGELTKKGSSSGAGILRIGFHIGILSILVLYSLFWMKLNLVQTLPILVALEVVTLAVGSRAAASKQD